MDKIYILRVANEILSQLLNLAPANVVCSWGITKIAATPYKGDPALRLTVTARLHCGEVYITLTGEDLYDIYLVNPISSRRAASGIGWENLWDILDTLIEKGTDPKAYQDFCENEKKKLLQALFN